MKNKNILLSFIVGTILYSTNLQGASLWDKDSIFSNVTEMSVATDPISGGTYLHGGAIEVRFKSSGSYPPIFQLGAPSLRASCRGISFDAGYAMFMNLERLGQQLSQAGTSLAYGVLIGLVYTMPGVEQAFTKLNEWSQWLQSFLADSCNIGTNIGKKLGGEMWGEANKKVTEITSNIPSPSEFLEKNTEFKDILKWVYDSGTDRQKKDTEASIIGRVFSDTKAGSVSSYINSLVKKGEENLKFPAENTISIEGLNSINLTQSSQIMVYLLSSMMPNIAVDRKAIEALSESIKTKNHQKIAELVESFGENEKTAKTINAQNNIPLKEIINFLLNGTTQNSQIQLQNVKELVVALVSLNNEKGVKEEFVVLVDGTTGKVTNAFDNFSGYIKESKNLVYKTYNDYLVALKENTNGTNGYDVTPKVVSAYPMMYEIIRNIVLSSNKNTLLNSSSSDPEITNILDYISYKNAIALVGIAIENVDNVLKNTITEANNKRKDPSITNANASNMLEYSTHIEGIEKQMKELDTKISEMKSTLKVIADDVEKDDRIRQINDQLIQILRERNLRGAK
ncbi:conjugal transfer protein TraH (plasmid) [Aliarcobacter lanthieri]|uniref:conjugal transfer protein TraH n=1 Tax=Aliarcobacter lanthieri TaxID=1355374 RepID=UPI003AAC9F5A